MLARDRAGSGHAWVPGCRRLLHKEREGVVISQGRMVVIFLSISNKRVEKRKNFMGTRDKNMSLVC